MRVPVAVAVCVLVALTVALVALSKGESARERYQQRLDTAARLIRVETGRLSPPRDPRDVDSYFVRLERVLRRGGGHIEAIAPPADLTKAHNDLVAGYRSAAVDVRAVRIALERSDLDRLIGARLFSLRTVRLFRTSSGALKRRGIRLRSPAPMEPPPNVG